MTKTNIKIPKWASIIGQGGLVVALGYVFGFVIDIKQENRIDYRFFLQELEEVNRDLKQRVEELENEQRFMLNTIAVLSAAYQDSPIATWTKTKDGRMVSLNQAYVDAFLKPYGKKARDYISKTDEEFWGDLGLYEQGKRYMENDKEVMKSKESIRFSEKIIVDGKTIELIVYKYPILDDLDRNGYRAVLGVRGVAIPK